MSSNGPQSVNPWPRWHAWVLLASAVHSGVWGVFIIALPERSAAVYGFAKPPHELHLWQGSGLFITLLAVGYLLASRNPVQHWGLVLIGLLAKVLGAIGMAQASFFGDVPTKVLWLLPINDVIWWVPFAIIVNNGMRRSEPAAFRG